MSKFYIPLLFCFNFFSFAQVGFQPHTVIDSSYGYSQPQKITIADIDGDSFPDVVVGSSGKISWQKNLDGTGNFSKTKTVANNTYSINSIAVAEIDGDGFQDVVYSIWNGSQSLAFWVKNIDGLGTFSSPTAITTTGSYGSQLQVVDWDNDNDMDVICSSSSGISLFKNNGTGTFTTSTILSNSSAFHITDLNNDNLMDIVRVNGYLLQAYEQNTNGTLSLLETMDSFAQTSRIFSGDVDGDGDIDILTIFENGGSERRIKWYQNTNGLGTFANNVILVNLPNLTVTSSNDQKKLEMTDLDGDNKLDILFMESNTTKIAWYKNMTGTTFGSEQIISTNAESVWDIASIDLNNNGTKDILAATYKNGDISLYKNTNNLGSFSAPTRISYYVLFPNNVDVGDIDGDGIKDILSSSNGDNKLAWYKNVSGTGTFTQPQQIISNMTTQARNGYLRDMDGDGDLDVVATYFFDDTIDVYKILWFKNDGNGVFTTENTIYTGTADLYYITPVDIDSDGDIDIVAVLNTTNLMVLRNNGNGTFQSQQLYNFPTASFSYITIDDIDGDGDLDVINANSNKFGWYENTNGLGNFTIEHIIPETSSFTKRIYTSDLDGDGDKDIVYIYRGQNKIGWYENTDGQGTFGPATVIATVTKALSLTMYDVDGDGDNDIVCDAEQGDRLRWFKNNGDGTFETPFAITNELLRMSSIVVADMNADGLLDFVTSSFDDSKIAWFENLGLLQNKIQGTVRTDIAANGCTNNATIVPNLLVSTTKGSTTFSTFTNNDGNYLLYANEDEYTTTIESPLLQYEPNPLSHVTNFVGINQTEQLNFCMQPTTLFDELEINMYKLDEARPGFQAKYRIHIKNNGTTSGTGTLSVTYNNGKFSFITASQSIESQTANTLTFAFNNVLPFQTTTIDLTFLVATIPSVTIGESVSFITNINGNTNDIVQSNNTYTLQQTIVGSYDPNDITVLEGSQIPVENIDEYLHYIIRYQNTGNFYAERVRVENILDDKLDWSTFQLESFSHSNRVEIKDGNQVSFIFNAIYLASSDVDEEGSKGYIAYKIKPKSTAALGDIFNNTANIFFDFNPPIVTNTVTTEVVDTTLQTPDFSVDDIKIFPNPTKSIVTINTDQMVTKVEIYNQVGQVVFNGNAVYEINVSNFMNGIYFLRITNNYNQVITKKIVKN